VLRHPALTPVERADLGTIVGLGQDLRSARFPSCSRARAA